MCSRPSVEPQTVLSPQSATLYLSHYPDAESDVALRLDRLAEGDARASRSGRRRLRYSLPEERPSPPVRPRSVAVRGRWRGLWLQSRDVGESLITACTRQARR